MRNLAFDSSLPTQRVREFFLARQPILNRDQELVAYELLFRAAAAGPANVTNDLSATASVIAHAAELGMENVIGDVRAFVNVDAAMLSSDIVHFLPKDKFVLEILETVKVTNDIMARVKELAAEGFIFALDDVIDLSDDVQKLLPMAHIVKVDIAQLKRDELVRLSSQLKAAKKRLLAEKVENLVQYQYCLELGFDFFQGYYFAKPMVLTGKRLSPSQLAIMRLMSQIATEADAAEIELSIKRDASLGLTLLRLVNTPAAGITERIDSIGQALKVLGRRHLQRWLQILLYAESEKVGHPASLLLMLATTRGRLLELIAEKIRPGNRSVADIAFTVGIMSLMDALFGLPMEKILEQLPVADEVKDALLSRSGIYGDMLKLVECIENLEEFGPQSVLLLKKLHLSTDEFYELQLKAFEWSDSISRSTT